MHSSMRSSSMVAGLQRRAATAPLQPANRHHQLRRPAQLAAPPTATGAGAAAAGGGLPADDGAGAGATPSSSSSSNTSSGATPQAAAGEQQQQQQTLLQRVKRLFLGDGDTKERLKALGMGAFASYGFVSNLNYGTALGIAWLAFVKKYGVAPTAPGQWGVFLAFYAGLWAVQNFLRPLRLTLALALAPAFDRVISGIADRLGVHKNVGFGIFLFGMAVITSSLLFGTLYALGGFPSNTVPLPAK